MAQSNEQNQAQLIYSQLITNGYLTSTGQFTDKLKNDIFGHSASDTQNYQQLDLGTDLSTSREAIYLALKEKRDHNLVLTKAGTTTKNIIVQKNDKKTLSIHNVFFTFSSSYHLHYVHFTPINSPRQKRWIRLA